MKRQFLTSLSVFALLMISMGSCEVLNDLVDLTFTTHEKTIDFTVNPTEAGPHTFVERILQSDIQAEIEENGGSMDNLRDITIKEARLEMITPGQNLDPFESVKVYIKSENHAEVLVGSVENINNGQLQVNLNVTGESLMDILQDEEYTVRVEGVLSDEIVTILELAVKIKYEVKVGI